MLRCVDLKDLCAKIQELVVNISLDTGDVEKAHWTNSLQELLELSENVPDLNTTEEAHREARNTLDESSVKLWNFAVIMNTKNHLSPQTNAKMRQVACTISYHCFVNASDDISAKKQIMMSLKTGRAWLDCGDVTKADVVLSVASYSMEALRQLTSSYKEGGTQSSDEYDRQKAEMNKNQLKLLSYRAEAAFEKAEQKTAMDLVLTAKELLSEFPKESVYLSTMCYNNGVDCYHKRAYEEAEDWLRLSYDIGKLSPLVYHDKQAKTLRLLATCYLDWDPQEHINKATNAVSLANSEHLHIAGLYLKIRVSLLGGDSDDVVSAVIKRLMQHPSLTVDMCLTVGSLLTRHSRHDVALLLFDECMAKFSNSSCCAGQIHLAKLRVLIAANYTEKIAELIEIIIASHNTDSPLDTDSKQHLQLLFWQQAADKMQAGDYDAALLWYNHSAGLFGFSGDGLDENRSKLQRNCATCYIHTGMMDKAKDAIKEAVLYDPSNPYSQYISYKIALIQQHSDEACEALSKMAQLAKEHPVMESDPEMPSTHDLICLAAQTALDNENEDVAITALKCLVTNNSDSKQSLIALRCLVRLQLSRLDRNRCEVPAIMENLAIAQTVLEGTSKDKMDDNSPDSVHNEAEWFSKIAWNLALQCEHQLDVFKQLFKLAFKFSLMEGNDLGTLNRQQTSLMMSVAAGLQQARILSDSSEQRECLLEALELVVRCRQISDSQQVIGESRRYGTTNILLLLYEFEAKAKLRDPGLEAVLEKVLALPYSEAKTFETIAALAMEPPAQHRIMAIRALKAAIRKYTQQTSPDVPKLSKLLHSLVALALRGAVTSVASSKDEAFSYISEVIDIIDQKAWKDYPELELVWLMTKSWNHGIHFFSCGLVGDAEKWCALSMKLLKHLHTLGSTYQLQMATVYGDILSQLGQNSGKGQFEE